MAHNHKNTLLAFIHMQYTHMVSALYSNFTFIFD